LAIVTIPRVITPPARAAVGPNSTHVTAYFTQWSIYRRNFTLYNVQANGQADRLTHINYAFGDISPSYQCATVDAFADYNKIFKAGESVDGVADTSSQPLKGNFNELRKLKLLHPNLKVIMSIGGWSLSANFSQAAMPANRAAFMASCIDMYLKG